MKRMFLLGLILAACSVGELPPPRAVTPEPLPREPLGVPVVADHQPDLRQVSTAAATPDPVFTVPTILEVSEGEATYYASYFDGRRTASGVVFRNDEMYAAHRTWPFGTVVRVTRVSNGKSVIVTIWDRGPHGSSDRQRRTIIDLSRRAADELGFVSAGRTPVRVEVLQWGR